MTGFSPQLLWSGIAVDPQAEGNVSTELTRGLTLNALTVMISGRVSLFEGGVPHVISGSMVLCREGRHFGFLRFVLEILMFC